MTLPFSHDAFLDVFGAYNTLLWPAAAGLWLVTAALALDLIRRGRVRGQTVYALLTVHWAWSGIAYHWLFFRAINPAATLFAAGFVLQAVLFAWLGLTSPAQFTVKRNARGIFGSAFIFYGIAYPIIALALDPLFPRMPLFAVPCPTTLVTTGLLLIAVGVPRLTNVIPILWAVIGSSAAFTLGIPVDAPLVLAAGLLALDTVAPSALGVRPPPSVVTFRGRAVHTFRPAGIGGPKDPH